VVSWSQYGLSEINFDGRYFVKFKRDVNTFLYLRGGWRSVILWAYVPSATLYSANKRKEGEIGSASCSLAAYMARDQPTSVV